MTHTHRFALAACLAIVPLLAACDRDAATPTAEPTGSAPSTALGRTVDNALREAREKIATENIGIGGDADIHIGGANINSRKPVDADGNPLPKAEISPAGDLLIGGQAVAVTPDQRALLLDYRGHVIGLIEAGMVIGVKGADLGMRAASDALKSVFSGETGEFEQRVEAEAAELEAEAMKLCDLLPPMLQTQGQLGESLPEFRPYATMTVEDIEDCRSDTAHTDSTHDDPARRHEVRDSVRSTIRESIRAVAQSAGVAEGGTPEPAEPTVDETTTP